METTSNLTHGNEYMGLPILPEPEHGNRIDILEAIRIKMNDMTARHCKVFASLIGLNLPDGTDDVPHDRHVEAFMEAFGGHLESRGIDHTGLWVQEQGDRAGRTHFHALLLMNGNKTRSFYGDLRDTAIRLWASILGVPQGDGLVHLYRWAEATDPRYPSVRNGGVMMIRNSPDFAEAYAMLFKRCSYMAKSQGKDPLSPDGSAPLI